MECDKANNCLARSYPAASTLSNHNLQNSQVKSLKAEIVLETEVPSSNFESIPSAVHEQQFRHGAALEPILLQTSDDMFGHVHRNNDRSFVSDVTESASRTPSNKGLIEEVPEIQELAIQECPASQDLEVAIKRGVDGLIGFAYEKEAFFDDEPYVIYDLIPMKPAAASGLLRIGDELHRVDGLEVHDKSPQEVANLVKGRPGTIVTLSVRRVLL